MSSREAESARIFLDAVEHHEPGRRAAFVQEAAAGDPVVLQRVDALLKAHGESNSLLDGAGLAATADLLQACERPGAVIGPYKLLEQIGEGGMGLVFVAEQSRPVRRKVALKLIKPGMDSKQVLARFEAERQALALMDHPNIAKIHDAGTTESGRPYFVMELVRGVPITEYCDAHRLDVRRRLGLFVQVCQAVQHAHHKGVIHRDLKPGNVLVAHDDTVAVPKVIDFGVANATTQPLTERTVHTALSQVVGTPLYMSPEQAALHHQDVDTRSDVYALAVLLYELLTGTTPLEGETLRRVGLDEVRRMIREEEPPVPSQRVSTLGAARLTTLSERRAVEVRRLPQVLRGELDWVVMRALEKDRSRRYESASAFAADVQRHLNDEPVEACPPSAAYRLKKYVRRNRRMLLPAGVVVAALVAATAVSAWQASLARDALRQAEADRDQAESSEKLAIASERRANTEVAVSREVIRFLEQDIFSQVSTESQLWAGFQADPNLTVKEALRRAATKVGDRFRGRPLVEAAIRMALGWASRSVGDTQSSIAHMERALVLRKDNLGPDHPDTLDTMHRLACQWEADGQSEKAVATLEEVLERFKAKNGLRDINTLACMHNLAIAYHEAGRSSESIALHESLLPLNKSVFGLEKPSTLHIMRTFAREYQWAGKFDASNQLLRDVLDVYRRTKPTGSGRLAIANTMDLLGLNLLLQQKYLEAEPILREALTIYETYRPDYWRRFSIMCWLGEAYLGQRKYAAAEQLLLQGYEGMKEREATMFLSWRPRMYRAMDMLVRLYEETNRQEKARLWRQQLPAERRRVQ